MTLETTDFRAFWRSVHHPDLDSDADGGPAPFGWQQQLVDRICEEGRWPAVIDIPTGLGKTTVLDIAVFASAFARVNGLDPMPLRTFLVIDRRVIVDQAFEHAMTIHDALMEPAPGSVLQQVADALEPKPLERHDLEANDETALHPLVVGRMRGGTTWAWRWLERPDQPAIIIGTVDQLGSRMLFDGYGVGENLRPIDAALTGTDSLVIVDEAHLADAFVTTIGDAASLGRGSEQVGGGPAELVIMSATVRQPEASNGGASRSDRGRETFMFDHDAAMSEPVARERLTAPKSLVTASARVSKKHRVAETGAVLGNAAWLLAEKADVIGVVANTVAVARAAFDDLRRRLGSQWSDRLVLITGRQRPIDRQLLWDAWRSRIEAGRDHQAETIFVVATQAIEVGADLDFSALVTESASIDALVQRLGRLNRRGKWTQAQALVVHPSDAGEQDPIYGPARQRTWDWLTDLVASETLTAKAREFDFGEGIDASPGAIDRLTRTAPPDLRTDPVRTPVLFPHVLERWVQTSPRPYDAPETGPFLHGLDRDLPTASVVWRHVRDVEAAGRDGVLEQLVHSLELLPVSAQEAVDVPVWAVEAWLSEDRASASEVPDWETHAGTPPEGGQRSDSDVVLTIGSDGTPMPLTARIRPGTTIVVPGHKGGLDAFGWNPQSTDPVPDIADLVEHRISPTGGSRSVRRTTLRVEADLIGTFLSDAGRSALAAKIETCRDEIEEGGRPRQAAGELLVFLDRLLESESDSGTGPSDVLGLRGLLRERVALLSDSVDRLGIVIPEERDGVIGAGLLLHGPGSVEIWSTEATHVGTSMSGEAVSLDKHQKAVAQRAATFADALGLPESVRESVIEAAAHHDLGKLDPRFQTMLNGGVGLPVEPLAKSGMDPSNARLFKRSRQLAGYPRAMRHEAFSALAVADQFAGHPERDLIVHLVAAHHGRARPLAEVVPDDEPVEYSIRSSTGSTTVDSGEGVDWEQPRRFRELNERFGPWGLALLETVVRLADIGCSAEGS